METDGDDKRVAFLKRMDSADHGLFDFGEVTDWEAAFIESNLGRDHFSQAQRRVIDALMDKYGET